jgi:hypothetical protein
MGRQYFVFLIRHGQSIAFFVALAIAFLPSSLPLPLPSLMPLTKGALRTDTH